jgi:small GTP-binding protein
MNTTLVDGASNYGEKKEENSNGIIMPFKVTEFVAQFDYMFRICIIGDANVGKTSLLTRYCDNVFKETYTNTIGVDFRVVSLRYRDLLAKIHVWDTAGQERFKSITMNYFRSTHGFIFVYDVTNKSSFNNLQSWVEMAFNSNKNTEVNFLVGNKVDMVGSRAVSQEAAMELASMYKMHYLETSALSNENVSKLFEYFGLHLIEYYSKNKKAYEGFNKEEKLKVEASDLNYQLLQKKKKKSCC